MKIKAFTAVAAVLAIGMAGCAVPSSVNESSTEQFEITTCPSTFPHAVNDPNFSTPPITSIVRDHELIITDSSVVENSCQAGWTGVNCGTALGKWTFGWLMTAMSGQTSITSTTARKFVANWLTTWLNKRFVGQDPTEVARRPKIWDKILKPWLQGSGCTVPADTGNADTDAAQRSAEVMNCANTTLDLTKAPFRLSAIVNRIDLDGRDYAGNGAPGELRFVFGAFDVTKVDKPRLNAAVILEYHFPPSFPSFEWARSFHQLSSLSFESQFITQLQNITNYVVEPNVWGERPNGSAIAQVRTNENEFDPNIITSSKVWEFRQFALSTCTDPNLTGSCLTQVPVSQTPPNKENDHTDPNKVWLTEFLIANQNLALTSRHVVPPERLGGSSLSPQGAAAFVWNTKVDINDPNGLRVLVDPNDIPKSLGVRHGFAFSTCNGCHYLETQIQTQQFHIAPRNAIDTSVLSNFIKLNVSTTDYDEVPDPNPESEYWNGGVLYFRYNEIWRRACEVRRLLSGSSIPWSTPTGHH